MLNLLDGSYHMMRIDKTGETLHQSIGVIVFNICYSAEDWFHTPQSRFVELTCVPLV